MNISPNFLQKLVGLKDQENEAGADGDSGSNSGSKASNGSLASNPAKPASDFEAQQTSDVWEKEIPTRTPTVPPEFRSEQAEAPVWSGRLETTNPDESIILEADPYGFDGLTTGRISGAAIFFDYIAKAAIYLAIFLTPLFFFNSSDTVNLSKQLLLSSAAVVALVGWIGKIIVSGQMGWRKHWLLWPVLGLALSAVLSSIFSGSFWISFLGDAGRYSASGISILSYFILFLAAFQNFDALRSLASKGSKASSDSRICADTKIAIAAWLSSSFLAAVFALLQFAGIYVLPWAAFRTRLFNSIGGVYSLSLFSLMSLPVLLMIISEAKNKIWRAALIVAALTQLALSVIIDFKASWIALIVAALALAGINFVRLKPSANRGNTFGSANYQKKFLLPLALFVAAVFMWLINVPAIASLKFPVEINPSYRAGFDVWKSSAKENLVFGTGLETFPYAYARFKSASLNQTNFWGVNFNDANAELLTWAVTSGLLGLAMILVFIFGFGLYALGQSKKERVSTLAVAILASWIFMVATKFLYPSSLASELFFWLLPALFILQAPSSKLQAPSYEYRFQVGSVKTLAIFFVLMVALLGALLGGYFTVRRWNAEMNFVKAVSSPNTAEARDKVLDKLNAAIVANPYESRYFRVMSQVILQKINDTLAAIQARPESERKARPEEAIAMQNLAVRVISATQRAQILDPKNVGVMVDSADVFNSLTFLVQGADNLALQNYEQAVKAEPINPFIKTQLGQLYLSKSGMLNYSFEVDQEMLDKARNVLDEALKLNPNYANALFFASLIADRDGKKDVALNNFKILEKANPENQLVSRIVKNLEQGWPALGLPPAPATPPLSPKAETTKGVPAAEPIIPAPEAN